MIVISCSLCNYIFTGKHQELHASGWFVTQCRRHPIFIHKIISTIFDWCLKGQEKLSMTKSIWSHKVKCCTGNVNPENRKIYWNNFKSPASELLMERPTMTSGLEPNLPNWNPLWRELVCIDSDLSEPCLSLLHIDTDLFSLCCAV